MSAPAAALPNTQAPKSLVISLTGHAIVVLVLTVKTVFFPSEDIIIANAIRVDIVALPDKIKPPAEEVVAPPPVEDIKKPEVQKEVKKPETKTFDLEKAQLDQKKALENLKNQLKRDQSAVEEVQNLAKKPEQKIYKGNILAPGSEVSGVAKIEYEKYFDQIRSSIKRHLVLPKWLKDANLKAHVLIKVDERGFVVFRSVVLPSGNEMYDNLVLTAIAQSSPLPAPPERLTNIIHINGITLRFPDR